MADTAFTVKVDDKLFVLDRILLGDWRMLKTEFGLKASDIITELTNDQGEKVEIFNIDDPNVLVGLMVCALRHERPHAPLATLIAEVEALGMDTMSFPDAESASGEPEADAAPLAVTEVPAVVSEATATPVPSGSVETTPPTPGVPSTPSI